MPELDSYRLSGGFANQVLRCTLCNQYPTIKSNRAIAEERDRAGQHLFKSQACCPHDGCTNAAVPVTVGPGFYQAFGKTQAGSVRYKCMGCLRTFSVSTKATLRQRQSHKNRLIFNLLINKVPMNRILEIAEINAPTLYQRIDFFYNQCLSFAAGRERALMSKPIKRLYLETDRQAYIVNWTAEQDKRNVLMLAVGTADQVSSYVFDMTLDYDHSVDKGEIEKDVAKIKDSDISPPFRKYARLWLEEDYKNWLRSANAGVRARRRQRGLLLQNVEDKYAESGERVDIEEDIFQGPDVRLPARGMQVHNDYTLYGHFFHLQRLIGHAEKIRIYCDQESGIRAAILSAFCEKMQDRTLEAFYVRARKDLTMPERKSALKASRAEFKMACDANKELHPSEVKLKLIQSYMNNVRTIGKFDDRWVRHPFPDMSEPDKAMCHLTDVGQYDGNPQHLARLFDRASLHAIDRFFMQLRRRLSLLERPIATASKQGRKWHGYSPYNPAIVIKMLAIIRVCYNYVFVGKDGQTPAMRLGLARAPMDLNDIIYFKPTPPRPSRGESERRVHVPASKARAEATAPMQ